MTYEIPDEHWLEGGAALESATNSFIVIIRARAGPAAAGRSNWHGSVEHAQTRERVFFIDFSRLTEFIASRCQTPLEPHWRTRASRRWQKSALHHWLNPLPPEEPGPLPADRAEPH